MMQHCFVTGGAGFIGSNLVDRLLAKGLKVTAFDNFSTGFEEFLTDASKSPNFRLVKGDVLDEAALKPAMQGSDFVFHLAANADVRFGTQHPRKDIEQNAIATHNVLEAMRTLGINKIAFSSTGSIYGESTMIPTPENAPFPIQTSLYGTSKLAAEGLISAYCEGFGMQSWIFRFVSVLGERYTHGHVFDFYRKLTADPTRLDILGNGHQRKSYMYVHDCIDGLFLATDKLIEKVNIVNLGYDGYCEVNDSVGWICKALGVTPKLEYAGGERGWIGDSPFIYLDVKKIMSLGWKPSVPINEGILRTLQWLQKNDWVFSKRRDA